MRSKVDAAIKTLKKEGHNVLPCIREKEFFYEIDGKILVSWNQMEAFAAGVYSLADLAGIDRTRHRQKVLKIVKMERRKHKKHGVRKA